MTTVREIVYLLLCLGFLLIIPGLVMAEGDPFRGKTKYIICASCHGANAEGNGETGAPRLQGQHDWYLVRQLNNFRKGIRGAHEEDEYGHQMMQMSRTLEDEQAVADVVSYIGTLAKQ
jgi:cytochrome c oxidase subunit 2